MDGDLAKLVLMQAWPEQLRAENGGQQVRKLCSVIRYETCFSERVSLWDMIADRSMPGEYL